MVCTWWELTTRRNSSSSRVPDEFFNERKVSAAPHPCYEQTNMLLHVYIGSHSSGFTAPPARPPRNSSQLSFETLKDLTLPKQVADRRHKSVSVAKLDLRSSGNRSLSCLWSQQVFEPQSKNAGERVICQKRKGTTR